MFPSRLSQRIISDDLKRDGQPLNGQVHHLQVNQVRRTPEGPQNYINAFDLNIERASSSKNTANGFSFQIINSLM